MSKVSTRGNANYLQQWKESLVAFSTSTGIDGQWGPSCAYQWWFLRADRINFRNWCRLLTCEAERVQGTLFTTGICCCRGDWEGNRAVLAQQETSSQRRAAKPTCPPAGQTSRDFCFPGPCGPNGVHSAGLLAFAGRSLARGAQRLTFAALARLVPLGPGTADPACQLWDKVDDLARLLYPVCCVILWLSLVCVLPLRSLLLSRAKKNGFEIEYWAKLSNKSLAIIVFTSLREIKCLVAKK